MIALKSNPGTLEADVFVAEQKAVDFTDITISRPRLSKVITSVSRPAPPLSSTMSNGPGNVMTGQA